MPKSRSIVKHEEYMRLKTALMMMHLKS